MSFAPLSFTVATTLSAKRIVAISAANSVGYPGSAQVPYIGVTVDTVVNTTDKIPVAVGGLADVYFNDTATAASIVGSDTSGRGIKFTLAATTTSLTLGAAYLGPLVGAAVAATGTEAAVLIMPGFDRVAG